MLASIDAVYVTAWVKALGFTWLVEVGFGVFVLGLSTPAEARPSIGLRLALLFLASGITHPFVWFVFPFIGLPYMPAMILAELFAVLVETGVYYFGVRGLGLQRAFATSLFLNGASLGIGLVLRHFWGLV